MQTFVVIGKGIEKQNVLEKEKKIRKGSTEIYSKLIYAQLMDFLE